MATKPLTIYIDLDGTILDVTERHYAAYRQALEKVRGKALSQEHYWRFKQNAVSWDVILEASAVVPQDQSLFLKTFMLKIESEENLELDTLIHPNLFSVLATLVEQGELHLVTMRRKQSEMMDQLRHLDLLSFFKSILSPGTPHMSKVSLVTPVDTPRLYVTIGDTEEDIALARKLGGSAIAVLSGIRDRTILETYNPDFLISSIMQFPSLVKEISQK